MSEWAAKRFWKTVESRVDENGGFGVWLDGRPVNTPGKTRLIVPTEAVAARVAEEWDAQEGVIDPNTMPWTKSANSAIDKVAPQRAEVEAHIASYAGTDLLSYRADGPDALVARQAEVWDPVLDWVRDTFLVEIAVTRGVMPVEQDSAGLLRLAAAMNEMSDFQITGFHDLVTISGSYLLGLAATQKWAQIDRLWQLSRVDEDWQIEQWGEDEEAEIHAKARMKAFFHAADFYYAAST